MRLHGTIYQKALIFKQMDVSRIEKWKEIHGQNKLIH
jgi:hypothetical protein